MKKLNLVEHPILEDYFIKKPSSKRKINYLIIAAFIMLVLTILFMSY